MRLLIRRLVIAGLLVIGIHTHADVAAAQSAPIDTPTVHALLTQVTTALDSTPALTNQVLFVEWFGHLRQRWGMSAAPVEPHTTRAAALVERIQRDLDDHKIYHALVRADSGDAYSMVFGHLNRLVDTALHQPWPIAYRDLQAYLDRGRTPPHLRNDLARIALLLRATFDVPNALAQVDTMTDPVAQVTWKTEVLMVAMRQRAAVSDSLLRVVHADITKHVPRQHRETLLNRLLGFCESYRVDSCYEVMRRSYTGADTVQAPYPPTWVAWPAMMLAEDTASTPVTSGRYALAFLRVALGHQLACADSVTKCSARHERYTELWLRGLQRWMTLAESRAIADSMRVTAALLYTGRNTARAFQLVEQVADTMLRTGTYEFMATRLLPLNHNYAWRAFLRAKGYQVTELALAFALDARIRGDTVKERLALQRVPKVERLTFELNWAERIQRTGQLTRARKHAMEALAWWPDSMDFGLLGDRVKTFEHLGILDELVRWARTRPTPTQRSHAMLAIVLTYMRGS